MWEEIPKLKCQRFAHSNKYAADNKESSADLIQNSTDLGDDYVTGANTDFSNVAKAG